MAKPGRPSPGLDDYLYWQERDSLALMRECAILTRELAKPCFYGRLQCVGYFHC